MLRTGNSVFKYHDRILSGLLHGSLRVHEVLDLWYTSAEKRSHSLSSVLHYLSLEHTQINTIASGESQTRRKPTRSHGRILLDSTATEQEDSSVSSNT